MVNSGAVVFHRNPGDLEVSSLFKRGGRDSELFEKAGIKINGKIPSNRIFASGGESAGKHMKMLSRRKLNKLNMRRKLLLRNWQRVRSIIILNPSAWKRYIRVRKLCTTMPLLLRCKEQMMLCCCPLYLFQMLHILLTHNQ